MVACSDLSVNIPVSALIYVFLLEELELSKPALYTIILNPEEHSIVVGSWQSASLPADFQRFPSSLSFMVSFPVPQKFPNLQNDVSGPFMLIWCLNVFYADMARNLNHTGFVVGPGFR